MKWFPRTWPSSFLLRTLLQCVVLAGYGLLALILLAGILIAAFQIPSVSGWAFRTFLKAGFEAFPESYPPQVAGPLPALDPEIPLENKQASDLFQWDHVWKAHLHFTSNQWANLSPINIPAKPGGLSPQQTLRNPKAVRSGLLGVIGWDLPWSEAETFTFQGIPFDQPRVRYKGNGTFLESKDRYKRSFKIDLNTEMDGSKLVDQGTVNLHSLSADRTRMSDALGYAYFRQIGIPSPRTCYVDLTLSIEEALPPSHLGLYLMVEKPSAQWLSSQWHQKGGAVLKPVTMRLFEYLGDAWDTYEGIYDPKTALSDAQKQHLLATFRWFNQPEEPSFQEGWPTYFDMPSVARFFAAQVLLSNYDGILFNGQNFLMTLAPETHLISFAPWDLDHCWGEFPLTGSPSERIHASIREPWIGEQFFVERLFESTLFQELYLEALQNQLNTSFKTEHWSEVMDGLAPMLRPVIAHEPAPFPDAFEIAQQAKPVAQKSVDNPMDPNRPVHQIKVFISERRKSVLAQLEGSEVGEIIHFEMGRASKDDPAVEP